MDDISLLSPFDAFIYFGVYFLCLDVIELFPGSYRSVCLGVHGKSLLYVVVDMPFGILDIF